MRAVVVTFDDLITQIKGDEKARLKVEEPIAINVFTISTSMVAYKKEDYDSSLSWYQKALKILLRTQLSTLTILILVN